MKKLEVDRIWNSKEDFSRCTGKGIIIRNDHLCLRRGVTVADEMGRCSDRDREMVVGLRQAKKIFKIKALNSNRAILCPYLDCDKEDGELDVVVNGQSIRKKWCKARDYWEDRWTPIDVPINFLKPGENEVVFRAVGDARWWLLVERGWSPARSAVSEDGGQTWRSSDLGYRNQGDGEYVVRLWIDQFVELGDLCSEIVDLLDLKSRNGIASRRSVSVRFETKMEVTDKTHARLEWRSGSTPVYDSSNWSVWQPIKVNGGPQQMERFLQWRVSLQTLNPAITPKLKKIRVSTFMEEKQGEIVRVVGSCNPCLIRSSYRFAYLKAHESRAKILRDRWKLNELIEGVRSEFEIFLRLKQWVRNQWEDGWDMGEIEYCPPWDAMVILELAGQKLGLGMCTHYATVMSHCCAALGLIARTQIMRSHCINEVWSSLHGKWIAMDVGGDSDDRSKFTYHFERNGMPLSALEAHQAWVEKDFKGVKIVPPPPLATGDRYNVEKRLSLFDRFMISLRNDELSTLEPGEPEHGKGSYHYDGYLFWQDGNTEPLPWFSNYTNRKEDLYWSVNQVKIYLQQGDTTGQLCVDLDTETPNLKGFEIRKNSGDWVIQEARFNWILNRGENRLEVRPLNSFGRVGTVSWVVVQFDGKF